MKTTVSLAFRTILTIAALLIAGIGGRSVNAELVLSTSTDNADLDFNGSDAATEGDLGFNSISFVWTGSEIPNTAEFSNITSLTFEFSTPTGNLSTWGLGIQPRGIGVYTPGADTLSEETGSLDQGESISVSVSSTSTNGDYVQLTGIGFASWRNFFPFSKASLSGTTFDGGKTLLSGADGSFPDPEMNFDAAVSNFSITGLSGDPIRMSDIRVGVFSAVPEPSSGLLALLGSTVFVLRRRRRAE